jgi:hypothetical protein
MANKHWSAGTLSGEVLGTFDNIDVDSLTSGDIGTVIANLSVDG